MSLKPLRIRRRNRPSLRERVEQARKEIERSRAASEDGEASRLTVSRMVSAWRGWVAAKPAPAPPPAIAVAAYDPLKATLERARRQQTPRAPSAAAAGPAYRAPTPAAANVRAAVAAPVERPRVAAAPPVERKYAAPPARPAQPPRAEMPSPTRSSSRRRMSSDLVLAGAGIGLGLLCAFFPWYVFMNQDQFGVRAMRFSGERNVGAIPGGATPAGNRILTDGDAPTRDISELPVDSFTTATLALEQQTETPGVDDQPFPGDAGGASAFRVVHVANGRAMIEDDSGLWVVERGAMLPDNSKVRSIEQRDGRWVVVTTDSRVFEMQP